MTDPTKMTARELADALLLMEVPSRDGNEIRHEAARRLREMECPTCNGTGICTEQHAREVR